MSRYSFPYQRALHSRLSHTTLKPVVAIGLLVVFVLPLVLLAVLALQSGGQGAQIARTLTKWEQSCTADLGAMAGDETLKTFLKSGEERVQTYERLYALRNAAAAGARFELSRLDGAYRASDLPADEDYRGRLDALLVQRLTDGESPVRRVLVLKQSAAQTPLITLTVPIRENGELLGFLSLLWTRASLDEALASYSGNVVLTAESGRIFYQSGTLASHESERFSPEMSVGPLLWYAGALYVRHTATAEKLSLSVHVLMPFDFILPVLLFSVLFVLMLVLVMTFVIDRVSYQVATGPLLKPFDELFTALKRYGEGDTLARIAVDPSSDTAPYLSQFNAALDEIDKLLDRNRELERATALSELKMLQSQLNPHFMFNMLDMIKYTIREDADLAVRMVLTLANMLRYTLDTRRAQVPVREDLNYLTDYLRMQALRLGELFAYKVDCPPDVLDCRVPKLIMQPLVENSVKYGFIGDRPFLLSIRLKQNDGFLVIEVENDGPGMDKAQVDALNASLLLNAQTGEHIGLYNTHRRLKLAYGENAGLTLFSAPDEGTRVTLRLRAVKGEENA